MKGLDNADLSSHHKLLQKLSKEQCSSAKGSKRCRVYQLLMRELPLLMKGLVKQTGNKQASKAPSPSQAAHTAKEADYKKSVSAMVAHYCRGKGQQPACKNMNELQATLMKGLDNADLSSHHKLLQKLSKEQCSSAKGSKRCRVYQLLMRELPLLMKGLIKAHKGARHSEQRTKLPLAYVSHWLTHEQRAYVSTITSL